MHDIAATEAKDAITSDTRISSITSDVEELDDRVDAVLARQNSMQETITDMINDHAKLRREHDDLVEVYNNHLQRYHGIRL